MGMSIREVLGTRPLAGRRKPRLKGALLAWSLPVPLLPVGGPHFCLPSLHSAGPSSPTRISIPHIRALVSIRSVVFAAVPGTQ